MKTAVLLDFDDTISNTTRYKTLRDEYYKQRFDKDFWKRFKDYEHDYATGKVKIFNLHDVLTDEELAITNRHLKEVAPSLLYDDFTILMKKIDRSGFTPFILTFGDKELQSTKIAAVGLDLIVIHTDVKNKTELIKNWRLDAFYKINGSNFKKIILVDDRVHNFDGFGELPQARGFLIQRGAGSKAIAKLPKKISVISSLDQIML